MFGRSSEPYGCDGLQAGREMHRCHVSGVVRSLIKVGDLDTAYRGEYLRLARERLSGSLSPGDYDRLKQAEGRMEEVMLRAQRAADLGDWRQVEELASQAEEIRDALARHEELLRAGDSVYNAEPVRLSTPAAALNGLTSHPVSGLDRLRSGVVDELRRLEEIDAGQRLFYVERRRHFERLRIAQQQEEGGEAWRDTNDAREALQAAIKARDWRRTERLAHALASQAARGRVALGCVDPARLVELGEPFAQPVLDAASTLGLRQVGLPDTGALRAYLIRALALSPAEAAAARAPGNGGDPTPRLRSLGRVDGRLAENLDLLAGQPFVNSAGLRYLPPFAAETILVEPFDEGDPCDSSPLLGLLHLSPRRGRTRAEIERALFARAGEALHALGLDPMRFSLICIPFDAYLRLAPGFGWGRASLWTHFDGYQLTGGDRMRALVGGDARYGGAADVCSVGRGYSDPHITIRFAVVRRLRLLAAATPLGEARR
jgi:hypothetical protein